MGLCRLLINSYLLFTISTGHQFSNLHYKWKVHKIVSVFTSGNSTLITNYCPISLLNNAAKKILYDKLIGHATRGITPAQFGFIQNHSSLQQLLLSDIFTSRHQLDIIYLDIAKAFDTISHSLLLHKFCTLNIGGELCTWFGQ